MIPATIGPGRNLSVSRALRPETCSEDLRAVILSQRDRIEELERILGLKAEFPWLVRLTGDQRRILGVLIARSGIVSQESLHVCLYGGKPDCDQPEIKIIDVQVCKMRATLKAYAARLGVAPVEIGTEWGRGFYLTLENRVRARDLIRGTA